MKTGICLDFATVLKLEDELQRAINTFEALSTFVFDYKHPGREEMKRRVAGLKYVLYELTKENKQERE